MKKIEKDQKNFSVLYLQKMMDLYMKSNKKEKIQFLEEFPYIMSMGEEICKNELEYFRTLVIFLRLIFLLYPIQLLKNSNIFSKINQMKKIWKILY